MAISRFLNNKSEFLFIKMNLYLNIDFKCDLAHNIQPQNTLYIIATIIVNQLSF